MKKQFVKIFFTILFASKLFAVEINYVELKSNYHNNSNYGTEMSELAKRFTHLSELVKRFTHILGVLKRLTQLEDPANQAKNQFIIAKTKIYRKKLKEEQTKKALVALEITIRNLLYNKLTNIHALIKQHNIGDITKLPSDVINTIIKATTPETGSIEETIINTVIEPKINSYLKDDIIQIFFNITNADNALKALKAGDKIPDEIIRDLIDLNKYVVYIQNWLDILVKINLEKKLTDSAFKAITELAKDIKNSYNQLPIKKQNQLAAKKDNLLNNIIISFYKNIGTALNKAEQKNKIDRIKELLGYLYIFNTTVGINQKMQEAIEKKSNTEQIIARTKNKVGPIAPPVVPPVVPPVPTAPTAPTIDIDSARKMLSNLTASLNSLNNRYKQIKGVI